MTAEGLKRIKRLLEEDLKDINYRIELAEEKKEDLYSRKLEILLALKDLSKQYHYHCKHK